MTKLVGAEAARRKVEEIDVSLAADHQFHGRHYSKETILECLALTASHTLEEIHRLKGLKLATLAKWLREAVIDEEVIGLLQNNYGLFFSQEARLKEARLKESSLKEASLKEALWSIEMVQMVQIERTLQWLQWA